jgi:hypothetical protein
MAHEPKGSQLMLWTIYVNCNSTVNRGNELWIAIDLFASRRQAGELKCLVIGGNFLWARERQGLDWQLLSLLGDDRGSLMTTCDYKMTN